MSAVASLLWPKNEGVLDEFLSTSPPVIYTRSNLAGTSPAFRARANQRGVRVELLETLIPDTRRAELREQARAETAKLVAASPWKTLAEQFPALELGADNFAALLSPHVAERIAAGMIMAEELAAASDRSGIELVVLNEDVTETPKAAAMWARSQGVPVLQLAHSCALVGKLRTNHREFHSDVLAVFGERGGIPYRDMGIPDNRIVITGNPAWDGFLLLTQQKQRLRAEVRTAYGLSPNTKIVLFVTTYFAKITTLNDPHLHEHSLEGMFAAHRETLKNHPDTQLVIKGRVNHPAGQAQAQDIAARLDVPAASWRYEDGPIGSLIVAADVVISVDSNASIEAMMAGVPALNYWQLSSALLGPFFRTDDGVLDVSPHKIAPALNTLFTEPSITLTLQTMTRSTIGQFAGPNDGKAGRRVADLMQRMRRPSIRGDSLPPIVATAAAAAGSGLKIAVSAAVPPVAAGDLIGLLTTVPATVLDLSAGDATLAEAIKQRWNGAHVIGVHAGAESAGTARTGLDRAIVADLDRDDLAGFGIAPGSIDAVIAPDVFTRLRDPWRALTRLKPLLSANAQLVTSASNVRLITIVRALAGGDLTYGDRGALDVRNVRLFTLAGLQRLFTDAGYRIVRIERDIEPSLAHLHLAPGTRGNIDTPLVQFKDLGEADLVELTTRQYRVVAQPR